MTCSWPCSTSRRCLRRNYRVGVPRGGFWKEILNSDAREYGGSGQGNCGGVQADPVKLHHRPFSLSLTLPPLGALFFVNRGATATEKNPYECIFLNMLTLCRISPVRNHNSMPRSKVLAASRSSCPKVRIDFGSIRSAFAVALHMHQPLIPAGGGDLATAEIISNLKYMMDNQGIGR